MRRFAPDARWGLRVGLLARLEEHLSTRLTEPDRLSRRRHAVVREDRRGSAQRSDPLRNAFVVVARPLARLSPACVPWSPRVRAETCGAASTLKTMRRIAPAPFSWHNRPFVRSPPVTFTGPTASEVELQRTRRNVAGAAAVAALLAAVSARAEEPAKIYVAKCQACHGVDGKSPFPELSLDDDKWMHGNTVANITKVDRRGRARQGDDLVQAAAHEARDRRAREVRAHALEEGEGGGK